MHGTIHSLVCYVIKFAANLVLKCESMLTIAPVLCYVTHSEYLSFVIFWNDTFSCIFLQSNMLKLSVV